MGKIRAILVIVFLGGVVCTRAQQQVTASLGLWNGNTAGSTALFATVPGQGTWTMGAGVRYDLGFQNVPAPPAPSNISATVTLRYQPRPGNTQVQTFGLGVPGGQGETKIWSQPNSTTVIGQLAGGMINVYFNRNPNGTGTPAPSAGLVCGSYTLTVAFTVNGQPGNAPQPVTGNVMFGGGGQQNTQQQNQTQQQAQTQQQNQSGSQQNQNQTGSQQTFQQQWQQQQLGTRISGRGSAVILRRRFNPKTGNVEVTMNGVVSRRAFSTFKPRTSTVDSLSEITASANPC